MSRPILDDNDDPVAMHPEVSFRRAYLQGAYEMARLIEAGAEPEKIRQWLWAIECWRIDGRRDVAAGRKVERLVPPDWD
jgi:hypothetical protein